MAVRYVPHFQFHCWPNGATAPRSFSPDVKEDGRLLGYTEESLKGLTAKQKALFDRVETVGPRGDAPVEAATAAPGTKRRTTRTAKAAADG